MKNIKSFFSTNLSNRIVLILIMIGLYINSFAQAIPANCLESPSVHFVDPINFLKENIQVQGAQRSIIANVWEFNTGTMTLDAIGIGNNMKNLVKTGSVNYRRADIEGNCCIKQKAISMKTISNCSSTIIMIKWSCGVGGQGNLPPNPGFINYNGFGYSKVGSVGVSINRTYLFKKDIAPINFLLISFQGIAVL